MSDRLETSLARLAAPEEPAASTRSWQTVRDEYRLHPPPRTRRPTYRSRLVAASAALVATGAIALSPAGATARHWITVTLGFPHPAPVVGPLHGHGKLLLAGSGGTWVVAANGERRRLGRWRQASWSPHGLYIAAADRRRLLVLSPAGRLAWSLTRAHVSDPTWYAPTGYRIAYLERTAARRSLRVVAGDGTGDHQLAPSVSPVQPVWRPSHPYQLAYVTDHGAIVLRADTGALIWHHAARAVRALQWSANGSELLVLTASAVTVFQPGAGILARVPRPNRGALIAAAIAPNGSMLAVNRRRRSASPDVIGLVRLRESAGPSEPVLAGTGLGQVLFAPDSRSVLVAIPTANQWALVPLDHPSRHRIFGRITQQFGAPTPAGFPHVEGWCCTAGPVPAL